MGNVVREARSVERSVIEVRGATGSGPTALAAFDDALGAAGVANFNLVRLSSVIPPHWVVRGVGDDRGSQQTTATSPIDLRERTDDPIDRRVGAESGGWGDRLYAVWAFQSAELLGQEAWAGVAWLQHPDDGRGLFVEHEAGSEAQVREELEASLNSIAAARGMDGLPLRSVVVGTKCESQPVGALVIAPYTTASW